MAVKKQHGVAYSDLDPYDPAAIAGELDNGVTQTCILDNKASPTAKLVLVSMWYNGGGPMTLDQGYTPAHQCIPVDVSSLGIAVTGFLVSWRTLDDPTWHKKGASALPGKYFRVFGISWDQNDVANLILHPAP